MNFFILPRGDPFFGTKLKKGKYDLFNIFKPQASAAGLSYIGIWVFSTYDHFDEIADASLTLLPASIILGVSVFMCVIGILACLAAFKNNKLLLATVRKLFIMCLSSPSNNVQIHKIKTLILMAFW